LDNEKIFQRELKRLHLSLKNIRKEASLKIAMTHFPPISADLKSSRVSKILEYYKIDVVVFGHLHHVKKEKKLFGIKNNIKYLLTSADYLDFKPLKIL
jgi:predicted phosphohydrolase